MFRLFKLTLLTDTDLEDRMRLWTTLGRTIGYEAGRTEERNQRFVSTLGRDQVVPPDMIETLGWRN